MECRDFNFEPEAVSDGSKTVEAWVKAGELGEGDQKSGYRCRRMSSHRIRQGADFEVSLNHVFR